MADLVKLVDLEHPSLHGVQLPPRGDLVFGRSVVESHAAALDERAIVVGQNFMVDRSAGQPVSAPTGDVYLNFLGIGAAGRGEIVLALATLPGLLEAYKRYGLIDDTIDVVEVAPPIDSAPRLGFPYTSPLELLLRDPAAQADLSRAVRGRGSGAPLFVGTFVTPLMRRQLGELGIDVVQRSDPVMTNNKDLFGRTARLFGYTVMPRVSIGGAADFEAASELALQTVESRLARGERPSSDGWVGVWLKLPGGSGGDFVQPIRIATSTIDRVASVVAEDAMAREAARRSVKDEARRGLEGAYAALRRSVDEAFSVNDYGPGAAEEFWARDAFGPATANIVAEQDVRADGTVEMNASNLMLLRSDGTFTIEGYFQQITGPEGDYRGSMPFDPNAELSPGAALDLERELGGIAAMAHRLGLRGFIGVDFFVIRDRLGDTHVRMTEMNGRIPISGTAKIIADKVGAPAWINVNLEAPEEIRAFDDFERLYGELARFQPGEFGRCRIIPQAFRTIRGVDAAGDEVLVPSRGFKALLVGPSAEACLRALDGLGA